MGRSYPVYTLTLGSAVPEHEWRIPGRHLTSHKPREPINPAFFTMPVDFRLKAEGWDTTVVLFNNSQSQCFRIRASHQPATVDFRSGQQDPPRCQDDPVRARRYTGAAEAVCSAPELPQSLQPEHDHQVRVAEGIGNPILSVYDMLGREVSTWW